MEERHASCFLPKLNSISLYVYIKAIFPICLLYICFSLVSYQLTAQDYTLNLQSYTVEDGLLHRDIQAIFEDDDGFVWIGTEKGLQRFDGHSFKSWTKADHTGKIAHITAINQDKEGWLWIWNNDIREFIFLDPKTEQIFSPEERFGEDFPIKKGIDGKVRWNWPGRNLKEDSKGRFYFACSNPSELWVLDLDKGFTTYPIPDLKIDFIELYFIDSKDNLWITESYTNSMLYRVDTLGKILNTYDYTYSYDVSDFKEVEEVVYFKVEVNEIETYFKIDSLWNPVLIEEELWKRKNQSSFYWNDRYELAKYLKVFKKGETLPLFSLDKKEIPIYFSNPRFSAVEGNKGRYWFPSAWGLGLATIKPNRFQTYFNFEDKEKKPINNSTRGILVEDDTVYANFEFGGLVGFPKNAPKVWTLLDQNPKDETYYGRPIAKTKDGGLFVGHANGVVRDIQHGTSHKSSLAFLEEKSGGHNASIWSFYTEPTNQRLWIGMGGGLAYKDVNSAYLQHISIDKGKGEYKRINHFCPDNEKLWLSSNDGLISFEPQTGLVFERYASDEKGLFHLPSDAFNFLHIDKEEHTIFWLGTNEGLLRWDRKKNEQSVFTTIDGLSNDVIYAIYEDDYNNLWLSSDYGIMQFNKETFNVVAYLEKDGIAHQEFNRTSAFQEKDGTIYFGGLNGITAFHPKDFHQLSRQESAKMLLTDFEIFDGESGRLLNKTGAVRTTNTIDFYPDDRFFRLTFSLPVFENIKKINYAWLVEGVDQDWNYQKENTIQIGKLPYGSHRLRIKGQNYNGEWSPHELDIKINVFKPFYLQNWFFASTFLLFLFSIWRYNAYRLNKLTKDKKKLEDEVKEATAEIQAANIKIQADKTFIEQQAKELKKLDQIKSRFFANVSHELRTPLSLMIGPVKHLLKNKTHSEKDKKLLEFVRRNSLHLKNLVNEILDLSKLENNKIELEESPVAFYAYVENHMAQFYSFGTSELITFTTEFPKKEEVKILLDKNKFEKIINNFLSNAMKFTSAGGTVSLIIEETPIDLHIKVKDTGRGIHPNDLPHIFDRFYQSSQTDAPTEGGTGIGLSLCWELAGLMNGKVWAESVLGKGSTFHFQFPKKLTELDTEQVASTIPAETVESSPSSLTSSPHQGATILIVEDNADLRAYYEILLSDYLVVLTENGQAALDFLQKTATSPHLIISDLMMPVMDGMQFLTQVKSNERWRHIPMIMLTAKANKITKLTALRIGIDDYITKPFDEEELLVRVQNLLSHQRDRKLDAEEDPKLEEASNSSAKHFSVEEMEWLERVEHFVKRYIDDDRLSVNLLVEEFNMSNSTLLRQLRKLTGLTPVKYIKEHRLNHARSLLENRTHTTIAQVAYKVGFKDANAFARSFKQRFGITPSEVMEN